MVNITHNFVPTFYEYNSKGGGQPAQCPIFIYCKECSSTCFNQIHNSPDNCQTTFSVSIVCTVYKCDCYILPHFIPQVCKYFIGII